MNKRKDDKITGISARIAEIIEYLGETKNSFAIKLGYDRAQTIYDILNAKSAPSFDFFYRFSITGYSAIINLDWLITGKGEMLCSNEEQVKVDSINSPSSESTENSIYSNLYKEERALTDSLKEEIFRLKIEIEHLKMNGVNVVRGVKNVNAG